MVKRATNKPDELSSKEISWLIGGADLLDGVLSPFRDEADAMAAYRCHEDALLELHRRRRDDGGLPSRWYTSRNLPIPRAVRKPGGVKYKGYCLPHLREKLGFE